METKLRITYVDDTGILRIEEIEEYGHEAKIFFVDGKVHFNDRTIDMSAIRDIGTIRGNFGY